MFSPGWVTAAISVAGVLTAIGGAYGVVRHSQKDLKAAQDELRIAHAGLQAEQRTLDKALSGLSETLKDAIRDQGIALERAIRDEFEKSRSRTNALLFSDDGITRYLPRGECEKHSGKCRADLVKRIEQLEISVHAHKHNGGPT